MKRENDVEKSEEAWREVGNQFVTLGQRLKQHFETGGGAGEDRESTQQALRMLTDAVDRAVSGLGDAVRDPVVREDAQRTATTFIEALSTTFTEVGGDLLDMFRRRGESRGSGGATGDASPTPPAGEIGEPKPGGGS